VRPCPLVRGEAFFIIGRLLAPDKPGHHSVPRDDEGSEAKRQPEDIPRDTSALVH
jgi:hypothetical protein